MIIMISADGKKSGVDRLTGRKTTQGHLKQGHELKP